MPLAELMTTCRTLSRSADMLAALGAVLALRSTSSQADPAVGPLLDDIVAGIGPGLLADLSDGECAVARAYVRSMLRQALDLVEAPDRTPGWTHDDPVLLDAQGKSSRFAIGCIEQLAAHRPALAAAIAGQGIFLDIGTGTAWLAIEAARRWTGMQVVGLDTWPPALALAQRNVVESGVSDRVTVLHRGLESVRDENRFAVAWLPAPFIPRQVTLEALPVLLNALRPGGTLVVATMSLPDDPLERALSALQVVRNGGHPWPAAELRAALEKAGFADVAEMPTGPLVLVAGTRPER